MTNYCLNHLDCAVLCVVCSLIMLKNRVYPLAGVLKIYFCCRMFFVYVVHIVSTMLRKAHFFFIFFYIKTNQSFWHHNKLEVNKRGITSMWKTWEKKKEEASFHSNLLHHTPKIQWITPCTPELTITVETVGAWNISYHLHFISAIQAKLFHPGSLKGMLHNSQCFSRAHEGVFMGKVVIFTFEISAVKIEREKKEVKFLLRRKRGW